VFGGCKSRGRSAARREQAALIVRQQLNAYVDGMDRRTAIETIAGHADEIRAFGVRRLYLFGSTARNEARRGSDVDVFIDLKRGARFSLFDLMDLRDYLRKLLHAKVDVFSRDGLHRVIRPAVERDAIRVI
jgi:predicted nucleotidyltransferase